MTLFAATEISNYDGQPIAFYEFLRSSGGSSFYWRYNSSDQNIDLDGNTFFASTISDQGVTQDADPASTEFSVTMPITESFAQMFRTAGSAPSDTVYLTVYRHHYGDTDAAVVWKGTVSGIVQVDEVQVRLSCAMLVASFRRGGLRLSYTRGCPYALYGIECKADPESFKITGTVDTITGNAITSSSFSSQPDGWLDGGYITWVTDTGLTERRGIRTHVGTSIVIAGFTFGLIAGDAISAYAGCRRIRTVCNDKFANVLNYGGTMMYSPGRNPFDGNPVF